MDFDEHDKRGVMQQVFEQHNNYYEKMDMWPTKKLTVMGLTYILLLPTSVIPTSILLSDTRLASSMATMTHNMKEDSYNTGTHNDDDSVINDDAEENGLGDNHDFDGFDYN